MSKCPSCGYCPHCGRKDASAPKPWPYTQPWINPYPPSSLPWTNIPASTSPQPGGITPYTTFC